MVTITRDKGTKSKKLFGWESIKNDDTQPPHFCSKHKNIMEYNSYERRWECNNCWKKLHNKAVIYQLKPIKRKYE